MNKEQELNYKNQIYQIALKNQLTTITKCCCSLRYKESVNMQPWEIQGLVEKANASKSKLDALILVHVFKCRYAALQIDTVVKEMNEAHDLLSRMTRKDIADSPMNQAKVQKCFDYGNVLCPVAHIAKEISREDSEISKLENLERGRSCMR